MVKFSERKMTWLEAAEQVLRQSERPLSAPEIVQAALEQKLVVSKGKTPHKTLTAEIWKDVKSKRGSESPFMRVESGAYRGRYWLSGKSLPEI